MKIQAEVECRMRKGPNRHPSHAVVEIPEEELRDYVCHKLLGTTDWDSVVVKNLFVVEGK